MVREQHCFCQIMDTNTKGKIAHFDYLRWAFFSLTKDFQMASTAKCIQMLEKFKRVFLVIDTV